MKQYFRKKDTYESFHYTYYMYDTQTQKWYGFDEDDMISLSFVFKTVNTYGSFIDTIKKEYDEISKEEIKLELL